MVQPMPCLVGRQNMDTRNDTDLMGQELAAKMLELGQEDGIALLCGGFERSLDERC